jgi:predicted small lipoprotein YifL
MLGFTTMSRQSAGRAAVVRRRPPRRERVLPVALRAVAIGLMLAGLAACGVKGPLRPPPRTVPATALPPPIDNPATPPPATSPALPPPSSPPGNP